METQKIEFRLFCRKIERLLFMNVKRPDSAQLLPSAKSSMNKCLQLSRNIKSSCRLGEVSFLVVVINNWEMGN